MLLAHKQRVINLQIGKHSIVHIVKQFHYRQRAEKQGFIVLSLNFDNAVSARGNYCHMPSSKSVILLNFD